MRKWTIITIISLLGLVLGDSTLEAKQAPKRMQSSLHQSKVVYTARITAAGFGSKINCEGKSLRKLAQKYGNICAIEQNTLPLYTRVIVSNKVYTIVDVIPRKSTNKHHRRAVRKGIDLDTCIDRYKDVPRKQLYKYDLAIKEIEVHE